MKYAEYVALILLCKHCRFGEKESLLQFEILNFSRGFLARRVYGPTDIYSERADTDLSTHAY